MLGFLKTPPPSLPHMLSLIRTPIGYRVKAFDNEKLSSDPQIDQIWLISWLNNPFHCIKFDTFPFFCANFYQSSFKSIVNCSTYFWMTVQWQNECEPIVNCIFCMQVGNFSLMLSWVLSPGVCNHGFLVTWPPINMF